MKIWNNFVSWYRVLHTLFTDPKILKKARLNSDLFKESTTQVKFCGRRAEEIIG